MDSDGVYEREEGMKDIAPTSTPTSLQVVVRAGREVAVFGNTQPFQEMFKTLGGVFREEPQSWVFPHEHRDQVESFLKGAEEPFKTLIADLPEEDVEDVDMSDPRVDSEILNVAEHEPSMIQHGERTVPSDEDIIEVDRTSPTDIAEPLAATTNIAVTATAATQTSERVTFEGGEPVITTETTTVAEVVAEFSGTAPLTAAMPASEPMGIFNEPLLLLTEVGSVLFPSTQTAKQPAGGSSAPPAPSPQQQPPLAVNTTSAQGDVPTVLPFSPRLYALVGNAKPWEDQLSKAGGKFKEHLKIGDGKIDAWTFPKRKLDTVHSFIPGLVLTQPVVQEHDAAAVVSPTKRRRTDSGASNPSSSPRASSAAGGSQQASAVA